MKTRIVAIVKGEVQGVGYRNVVRRAARKCGVVGTVRNLRNGHVEIVAEGQKVEIEEFLKQIDFKVSPIHVDEISVKYSQPIGQLDEFSILYGPIEQELAEGFDTGVAYLLATQEKLTSEVCCGNKDLGKRIDAVGTKVGTVGSKVHALRADTIGSFARLDFKYGKIFKAMTDIAKELREDRKQARKETRSLIQAILKSRR